MIIVRALIGGVSIHTMMKVRFKATERPWNWPCPSVGAMGRFFREL